MNRTYLRILACLIWLLAARHAMGVTTILPAQGPQPSVTTPQGQVIPLYDASFALAISVASYEDKKSWRDLPSTTKELDLLSSSLQKHGFQVTRVKDPTGDELDREVSKFLGGPGRNTNARIVVIFSGHGYVDRSNSTAYFVPRNAGSPTLVGSNFFVTALALEDFRTKVMRMPARHGLFIFDNCYSGMIFRSGPGANEPAERGATPLDRWRYLDRNAKTPVRQFISAGGPDEVVPGSSIFAEALVQGLAGAAARINDGYVTGKELGLFVSEQVTNQSRNQLPASDVLGSNLGDMVFQTAATHAAVLAPAEKPIPETKPSKVAAMPLTDVAINDLDSLRNELKFSQSAFNAKEASERFKNISNRLPHWYYPARMSAVKACQAYNLNLDTLKSLSGRWTADDYAILKCEISAYRALRQDTQLASAQARAAVAYEDSNAFTRKVIVGPTTYWTVNGQWTVVARRDGDTLHLSFTNGWVGGKTIDRVKKITVGAYLRPPDGGNWQQRHMRPCEIPFDGSSAKGSDIFSPVRAKDFQCTLQLQPGAKLAGVQVILTFDMGGSTTHMFSVPPLAPTRGAID